LRSKKPSLSIVLDEITPENLAIAVSRSITTDTAGNKVIGLMDVPLLRGSVKLVGTNDIGNRFTWTFDNVLFKSDKPIGFIDDKWGTIDLDGEVLFDATNNRFGFAEERLDATA